MKFMLDQTVGSIMNIVLFVVLINLLKGAGWNKSWELVCEVCFLLLFFILSLSCLLGRRWEGFKGYIQRLTVVTGLHTHHDRAPQVPAARVHPNVHCRSTRPASGVWKCVRGDLECLS